MAQWIGVIRMLVLLDGRLHDLDLSWGGRHASRMARRLQSRGMLASPGKESLGQLWPTAAGWAAIAYDDIIDASDPQDALDEELLPESPWTPVEAEDAWDEPTIAREPRRIIRRKRINKQHGGNDGSQAQA